MYDVIVADGPGTGVMIYDTLGTVTIASSQIICSYITGYPQIPLAITK